MGKLLRRKSPTSDGSDSEQLLAPRKNGLFGKRNIGVRSEDIHEKSSPKSLSARRFMTSVFHKHSNGGSKQKLVDVDDGSPPDLQLELFGDHKPHYHIHSHHSHSHHNNHTTPKTAPPSPDLVVLTTFPSKLNSNSPPGGASGGASKNDGDETVMSDLTGTVSPTAATAGGNPPQQQQQQLQPTPHGVSFASTIQAAPTQETYFSAYSGGIDNRDQDDEGNATNNLNDQTKKNASSYECKSTMLDQVLGVVDGACNRTLDMTFSGLQAKSSIIGSNGIGTTMTDGGTTHSNNNNANNKTQWGMAPSMDEESTCLDTYDNTTRTGTNASSYLCTTRDTTRDTTESYSRNASGTTTDDQRANATTTTGTVQQGEEESIEKHSSPAVAQEATMRFQREPSGLHENFELVLGHTSLGEVISEKEKKRGWTSRILKHHDDAEGEEKKEEHMMVVGSSSPKGKEATSGGKPPLSPTKKPLSPTKKLPALPQPAPGDVGVEIQSRRALQTSFASTVPTPREKTTPPPSPTRKKLSSFVKRIRMGVRRTKSATSKVGSSSKTTPSSRPPAEQKHTNSTKKHFIKPPPSSSSEKEEEKKEIEPADAIPPVKSSVYVDEHKASNKDTKDHPKTDENLSKPIKLFDKRSSSFKPERQKGKFGVEESMLAEPVQMSRLRSAPEKLASSGGLVQTLKQASQEQEGKKPPKLHWKAATDDKGRTYYYHRATRKTQWAKPPEFDAELAAVKKYKEEQEAIKQKESETQQIIEGCNNVEAIQASLRKKTQRDFDPQVWQIKQEILDIVKTMPLPKGTNIERLLIQYDGREQQLLTNLRELVESKPFDEPFQAPKKEDPPPSGKGGQEVPENLNRSHTSSSVSSTAHLHNNIDVQKRVRTALSSTTRISEKTNITEKTEKVRNTSEGKNSENIGTIREFNRGTSTGSLSSGSQSLNSHKHDVYSFPMSGRVPSKIPAVPRSRDLKVEVFANDRIAKETYNEKKHTSLTEGPVLRSNAAGVSNRWLADGNRGNSQTVAEQVVAMSSLDDDDDSYNGDYDDTIDQGNDTASENKDSISALSETDVDYLAQKENFERARRRALDVAVEREDWDLAAALSEGMKQVKASLYGKPEPQEWTQTELDRFISENDWDAVSKYIAHMRDNPSSPPSVAKSAPLPNLPVPGGRDPGARRDPEGSTPSNSRAPPISTSTSEPPQYVSEASKRASQHTQNGRKQQALQKQQATTANSVASSQSGSGKPAQTRFGARSQLQHSDLNSISSWDNSSSSYESEFTDGSYDSQEEQEGYISLRVKRNEFEC